MLETPKDMQAAIDHIDWTIGHSPTVYQMFRNKLLDMKGAIERAEQRELARRINND